MVLSLRDTVRRLDSRRQLGAARIAPRIAPVLIMAFSVWTTAQPTSAVDFRATMDEL